MKKHFLLLVILTLFPFIASNAVGNRALKLQTNSLLSEDELSYCIPDANSRTSSTERRLETITISGATSKGVSSPFSNTLNNNPQPEVYLDVTDATITATKGDELTISWTFRNQISWMHYYVYIDYDQDGIFNEENELVSYTYYNATGEGPSTNSIGETVEAGEGKTGAPVFTIPEDVLTGKTRLRLKIDWNSKNPCGNPSPTNPIGGNNGTIIDYSIDIQAKSTATTSTINFPESIVNGALTVKAGDKDITNGEEVANGTELTIIATPAEGYILDYLEVNNVTLTGNTYTVTEDAVITVGFAKKAVGEENKAVTIPKSQIGNYSGTAYRLEFPEILLGDRDGGDTDRKGKSFTISTWVNFAELTGSKNEGTGDGTVIMGHGAQAHMNHNGSVFLCAKPNGKLYLGGGENNITGRDLNADITIDTWMYLTIVYDNDAQSVSVYKDGMILETVEMGHQLNLFNDDPAIFYVGGVMFSGMCDEFQYFNKALTSDDVLTAYNDPKGIDGLTALYDFNSIAEGTTGQFENKIKSSDKADIKATFNKYTTSTVWTGNELVSGKVTEFAPTFADGRNMTVLPTYYTVTLPMEVANGILTVMNGNTSLTAGDNQVEKDAELTITATPAEGYILDYLKINDTPLTESTYTVTEDVAITVAFSKEPAKATAKAIHIPTNSGNTQYQFRFDDLVLGEHKNGTNNNWSNGIVDKGDYRARNFTMSAWVRPLNSTGDLFGHAQKSFYGAEGTFAVRINANNQLVLKARAWVNGSQCDGIQEIVSDVTLDINEWAFLTVAVDDDARSIKLYKNGVLLSTGDLSATKNGTEAHGIGLLADECIFFAGNGSSSCDVDEIQVWSKTLNTEEIATSMNGYINAPENLVAFYKFDENSIENIPNQGTGGTCDANLVSGTSAYDPSVWGNVYTCSPIQATLVDGHILPKFAINYVSETEHGSFVIKNGNNVITPGSEVAQYTMLTVEATPAEGYQVKSIKVNDTEIEGNTFIVNVESTVSVEFTDKLTINYTVSGVGTFTVIDENDPENPFNSGDEFEKNTSITMVLAAGEGYEISSFIVNGEEQKESINAAGVYTIANCQTDLNIDVVFAKKLFNVTFSSNDFGTLTVKQNNVNIESNTPVEYGTELTVIATPNANATLSVFTINGADKLAEIQNTLKMNITVSEELDIQAEFTTISRTVTCNIIGNGSVKIADAKDNVYENGVASIPDGSNITLTFIPEDGYQLNDFKYDGDSMFEDIIDDQFNFIADEDYTFDVVFTKITSLQNTSEDAVSVRYESGMLYVEGMNAGDKLDIYDITGKYIETSTLAATNVTDLANGCYLVRISLGNTIKTVKFIKR